MGRVFLFPWVRLASRSYSCLWGRVSCHVYFQGCRCGFALGNNHTWKCDADDTSEFPQIRSMFPFKTVTFISSKFESLSSVDFFRTSQHHSPPLACFLSHVHSDHLQGLESLKSPFVYCSAATREVNKLFSSIGTSKSECSYSCCSDSKSTLIGWILRKGYWNPGSSTTNT